MFFLNKLQSIRLNLVDVYYLENGLIKHLAAWSIELKSKIKLDNFETEDLDLIFYTQFFKLFGKFDQILPNIESIKFSFKKKRRKNVKFDILHWNESEKEPEI